MAYPALLFNDLNCLLLSLHPMMTNIVFPIWLILCNDEKWREFSFIWIIKFGEKWRQEMRPLESLSPSPLLYSLQKRRALERI